ncbi:hypothetical protein NC651_004616 [Populus alba x Populus x berolinensis]|nr:hypothetical protein NC651_004616 [Populus alba x Populus x berolinensis]
MTKTMAKEEGAATNSLFVNSLPERRVQFARIAGVLLLLLARRGEPAALLVAAGN